ncbi:MAG: heavy metal translocating P-type ATPase [Phycisphaerales bacterium]
MPNHTLRLPITLPPQTQRRSVCAHCIEERLAHRPGIRKAVVIFDDPTASDSAQKTSGGEGRGHLELDYDSDLLSLSQINGYLQTAGSCFAPSLQHIILPVARIGSTQDERTIQNHIEKLPGVRCVANAASQTLRLEFDRDKTSLARIQKELELLGLTSESQRAGASSPPAASEFVHAKSAPAATLQFHQPSVFRSALSNNEMVMAILAGLFLLAGAIVHFRGGPEPFRIALLLISYIAGGFYPAQDTVRTLIRFRLDIDVLMFLAAFGAASLGHYEEGAMLLFLFSLGGAGENLAMNRARSAIQALTQLAPKTAVLLQSDNSRREVPVEQLRIHDQVFVAPGQLIPADGRIASGNSAVNQAAITGESIPVDKSPDDDVFAGTLNGNGALTIDVLKRAEDNTLSKVIRMVEEAQSTKSPTQMFTDKVERFYVPLVVLATAVVAVVPPLAGIEPMREHHNNWAGWFYQAMAFLTAASPCALAIGTPAAVLSGIARAAKSGVLVKGGIHLENLGKISAIAFDKTGTLTAGSPAVTDVIPLAGSITADHLLTLTAALEQASRHPLAQAIVQHTQQKNLAIPPVTNIDQTPGVGIRGTVNGRTIVAAKPSSSSPNGRGREGEAPSSTQAISALESQGKTVVVIKENESVLGLIALADQPREGVQSMIAQLHSLGVKQTIMLTGDNARTAAAIARNVGIDQFFADLMPEQKLAKIRELDTQYHRVAMVGDGVNDAPALANATVGIAIGSSSGGGGSDVAMETADIVILGKNLHRLGEAIGVSRFSRHIIKQNLFIALGVIAVVAPIAALGGTPISLAVLLHEGSTVVVVLNALRILRYRPRA